MRRLEVRDINSVQVIRVHCLPQDGFVLMKLQASGAQQEPRIHKNLVDTLLSPYETPACSTTNVRRFAESKVVFKSKLALCQSRPSRPLDLSKFDTGMRSSLAVNLATIVRSVSRSRQHKQDLFVWKITRLPLVISFGGASHRASSWVYMDISIGFRGFPSQNLREYSCKKSGLASSTFDPCQLWISAIQAS